MCAWSSTFIGVEGEVPRVQQVHSLLSNLFFLIIYLISLFYFTILYWFCHTLTWICHGCTCVPHSETPPTSLPITSLWVIPSAPALSTLCHVLNLDWRFVSHKIIYMFQCHYPISSCPDPLPESKRLFYTSVPLLLSHIQGYCCHLSKFHTHALVYCIGVFLSGLLHSV